MAINPNNPKHREALHDDVVLSRRNLERFRVFFKALVLDYAGDLWADECNAAYLPKGGFGQYPYRIVLDLMTQAVNQSVLALSTNRPRARVSTDYQDLTPFSIHFEQHLNQLAKRARMESVLQQAVLQAHFAPMGIVRTGVLPAGHVTDGDPGEPGIEHISFDDWFHDTRAKCDERMRFMGHTSLYHMDVLRSDDNLDQAKVKRLKPEKTHAGDYMRSFDPVKEIEQGTEWDPSGRDMVALTDLWLPHEGVLLTMDPDFEHVLEEKELDLGALGPYELLRFARVPDSIGGLPGAYGMKALFELMNVIWRRLSRQVRNQKNLTFARRRSEELINEIKNARDGDVLPVDHLEDVAAWSNLGIDTNAAIFANQVQDQFNRAGGNYEHMAGLGPSAGTATQEQIIQSNVTQRLAKMQSEVANFSQAIFERLGALLWDDSVYVAEASVPVKMAPGPDAEVIQVPSEWLPGDREGDYWQYNFEVEPYSFAYTPPEKQAQEVMSILTGVLMPAMPLLQEQGIQVDFGAALESLARLKNVPELREFLRAGQKPNSPSGPRAGDRPGKSPVTSRNYTRQSVPTGGTAAGRRQAYSAAYGGAATPQQQQTVSTPG